jgi:hypothetical protein
VDSKGKRCRSRYRSIKNSAGFKTFIMSSDNSFGIMLGALGSSFVGGKSNFPQD